MNKKQIELAEKTFLALLNPYSSVERVMPLALRNSIDNDEIKYIGIKNRYQISNNLLSKLRKANYYLHTIDAQSLGGRAIDVRHINPITGKPMTGSSSGTAMNVFLGINDLGIGTDGGGSVLAPALSLNLYGFISKLISEEELINFPSGVSTDGITFKTSIGFMARDLSTLSTAIISTLDLNTTIDDTTIDVNKIKCLSQINLPFVLNEIDVIVSDFPDYTADRLEQINFLQNALKKYDFVISKEGPIDINGFGDTIFGHFDENTKKIQGKANKGLLKVANILGCTALCIPSDDLATGLLIICNSEKRNVEILLKLASLFPVYNDELINRYFRDLKKYVPLGYGEINY